MSERVCCGMAGRLPPDRLAALDEELQLPNHRGFKKLAVAFGTNHMAVKRHKHRCLGLATPEEASDGGTAEEAEGTRGTTREQAGDGGPSVPGEGNGVPSTERAENAPRARALESGEPPGTREDRVLAIVARIADGQLVPSDVPSWATEWNLHEGTVRAMVREAYMHGRVDRGTVDERRILAMGKWEFQIGLCDAALEGKARAGEKRKPKPLSAMDRALLLRERREAVVGWCKAAGVFDDSTKVNINIAGNPVFVACTEALFLALAPFPEAHAAARMALSARLQLLRQAPAPEAVPGATVPA